jgi:hypothetical protein
MDGWTGGAVSTHGAALPGMLCSRAGDQTTSGRQQNIRTSGGHRQIRESAAATDVSCTGLRTINVIADSSQVDCTQHDLEQIGVGQRPRMCGTDGHRLQGARLRYESTTLETAKFLGIYARIDHIICITEKNIEECRKLVFWLVIIIL